MNKKTFSLNRKTKNIDLRIAAEKIARELSQTKATGQHIEVLRVRSNEETDAEMIEANLIADIIDQPPFPK